MSYGIQFLATMGIYELLSIQKMTSETKAVGQSPVEREDLSFARSSPSIWERLEAVVDKQDAKGAYDQCVWRYRSAPCSNVTGGIGNNFINF